MADSSESEMPSVSDDVLVSAALLAGSRLKPGERIEIKRDVDGKLHIDVLVLSGAKYALANLQVGNTPWRTHEQ